MACDRVLLLTSNSEQLCELTDALRAAGVAVVRVDQAEGGLVAIRSGYMPQAIIIDADDEVASYGELLRVLFEEPTWRNIPVIAANRSSGVWYQVAPRHLYRKLPAPDDATQLQALLNVLASQVAPGDAPRRYWT